MKYAIISDIHANLAALLAVLDDIKKEGCTHSACLGDIVGFDMNPKECLDLIRGIDIPCVKGNFDEYCSTDDPLDGFNPKAAEAIAWTRDQLTAQDKSWLKALPYVMTVEGFTIVHSVLNDPARWRYAFDKHAAAASFANQKTPVCFFGHTHVPVAFVKDSVVRGGTYQKFRIESGKAYFINVGSVGQPRDTSPKAAYVTYDLSSQVIELRRVAFQAPPGDSGGLPIATEPDPPKPIAARRTEESRGSE